MSAKLIVKGMSPDTKAALLQLLLNEMCGNASNILKLPDVQAHVTNTLPLGSHAELVTNLGHRLCDVPICPELFDQRVAALVAQ